MDPSHCDDGGRGEYAGVDGSESMSVPKDFADMGGESGERKKLGVMGPDVIDDDLVDLGDVGFSNRCDLMLPFGDSGGGFGMP